MMRPVTLYRPLIGLLLCLPLLVQAQNLKIISSDWAIVETLVAMGHAPMGLATSARISAG